MALVACFSLSLSAMYLHVMQDAQFEVVHASMLHLRTELRSVSEQLELARRVNSPAASSSSAVPPATGAYPGRAASARVHALRAANPNPQPMPPLEVGAIRSLPISPLTLRVEPELGAGGMQVNDAATEMRRKRQNYGGGADDAAHIGGWMVCDPKPCRPPVPAVLVQHGVALVAPPGRKTTVALQPSAPRMAPAVTATSAAAAARTHTGERHKRVGAAPVDVPLGGPTHFHLRRCGLRRGAGHQVHAGSRGGRALRRGVQRSHPQLASASYVPPPLALPTPPCPAFCTHPQTHTGWPRVGGRYTRASRLGSATIDIGWTRTSFDSACSLPCGPADRRAHHSA